MHAASAQLLNDFAVMHLVEKLPDALRHDRPNIVYLQQLLHSRHHDGIQIAKVLCQILRRGLADMTNAETEQEFSQRRALTLFD